jgi:hypothetical protein
MGEDLIRRSVEESPEINADLIALEVTVELLGEDTARVTSRFNLSEFDVEGERWNVESGEWRNDDCTG